MSMMNMNTNLNNRVSLRCARMKKIGTIILSVMGAVLMFSLTAFAAVDPTDFITGTGKVLKGLLTLIGAGFAFFGIISLVEAYSGNDPGAKSTGIKQLMAGIAMIAAAWILVPILTDMMSDAMTAD